MKPWGGVGEAYAMSYASLCAGTIEVLSGAIGPAAGRTLLDVGAGTGELAARFRDRGWDATGCEPEPTMRAVAQRAHPELRFVEGALPALPFDDGAFDAVTANFVLNHVADPRDSARELARVATDGGMLGATIWVSSPSWFWSEVCDRARIVAPTGERLSADRDFARTPGGFASMLIDAGWSDVVAHEHSWTWEAAPAALWASASGGVASAGMIYRGLDDRERRKFRIGFEETCASHSRGAVIPLVHTAAVAVGRAL